MATNMNAVVMRRFGGPNVLEHAELERPEPADDEVRIAIEAAGLNRLDHYVREGGVNPNLTFPHVLGSDAVGVIDALGVAVNNWSIGDRVIPMPGYPMDPNESDTAVLGSASSYGIRGLVGQGTYAEYMTIPARWVLSAPEGVSAAEAATLPMPLLTAVRAVRAVGEVQADQQVLIHSGASGTGSMMIQVARALGARVATTVRTATKREFVESLGAELVLEIDGTDTGERLRKWSEERGVDVVVDNLGGTSLARSLEMLRPLGVVVLMGNVLGLESTIPVRNVFFPQRQIRGTLMGNRHDLEWGLQQVKDGRIRPTLDCTFSLDKAAEAHERLINGVAKGSIVLDIV